MAPILLTLLADAPPADPSSYQGAGWLLLALAGLATAGNQIMGLIEKFRTLKTPDPGEVSSDRVKALEDRVCNLEVRLERQMGAISSELSALRGTLTHIVADINFALGQQDGRK